MGKDDYYTNLPTVEGETVVQSSLATAQPIQAVVPVQATSLQLVEIVAPSDLAEGYQFDAEANGQHFLVTVPQGGVKAGQRFTTTASIPHSYNVDPVKEARTGPGVVGAWKDGLCDCFRYGCCHAHFCLGLWCTLIALAQVMTRMRLNWLGEPGSVQQVASTFKTVVGIWIVYHIIDWALTATSLSLYPDLESANYESTEAMYAAYPPGALVLYYAQRVLMYIFLFYILVATCKTRASVRRQYEIPETSCTGCEDCCCSYWCGCCTVMQMMRQTANYDQHAAACCTETGIPVHVQTV